MKIFYLIIVATLITSQLTSQDLFIPKLPDGETPVINGQLDEVWQHVDPVPIPKADEPNTFQEGTFRIAWNNNAFFIFLDIEQYPLQDQWVTGNIPFYSDGARIYMNVSDDLNTDRGVLDGDFDGLYVFAPEWLQNESEAIVEEHMDWPLFEPFDYAYIIDNDNGKWTCELKIPFSSLYFEDDNYDIIYFGGEHGKSIGLEVQITGTKGEDEDYATVINNWNAPDGLLYETNTVNTWNTFAHTGIGLLWDKDDPPQFYNLELIANPAEGGTVEGGGEYYEEAEVTINAVPSDDFMFINWTKDGEEFSKNPFYTFAMPNESISLTANFTDEIPQIDVDPENFHIELNMGESTSKTLTVYNNGGTSSTLDADIFFINPGNEKNIISPKAKNYNKASVYYISTYEDNRDRIFEDNIQNLTNVENLTYFDARNSTPGLDELMLHDIVIVASLRHFDNPELLGNLLADYVDTGGKLILASSTINDEYTGRPEGRIITPEYSPLIAEEGTFEWTDSENFHTHPITYLVDEISADIHWNVEVQGSGISVGEYETGYPVAAYNPDKPIVSINAIVFNNYWEGDLIQMIENTINWLMFSWMRFDAYEASIGGGEANDFEITFNAENVNDGIYEAIIRIETNDPENSQFNIPVTLDVTGYPDISLSHENIDFGYVNPNAERTIYLEIRNSGSANLEITDIQTDNDLFQTSVTELTIKPKLSEKLAVTLFMEENAGQLTAELTFNTNIEGKEMITIPMTAEEKEMIVTFNVVDHDNQPLENAEIEIFDNGNLITNLFSDENGIVVFDNLYSSEFECIVKKENYRTVTDTFELIDSDKELNITLVEKIFRFNLPEAGQTYEATENTTIPLELEVQGYDSFWYSISFGQHYLNSGSLVVQNGNATSDTIINIDFKIPKAVVTNNYKFFANTEIEDSPNITAQSHEFEIVNNTPEIDVVHPLEDHFFYPGEGFQIRWNSNKIGTTEVTISLSLDNGESWQVLTDDVVSYDAYSGYWGANDYYWIVPEDLEGTHNPSIIRIEDPENGVTGYSKPFIITDGNFLTFLSPEYADQVLQGEKINLITESKAALNVNIRLYDEEDDRVPEFDMKQAHIEKGVTEISLSTEGVPLGKYKIELYNRWPARGVSLSEYFYIVVEIDDDNDDDDNGDDNDNDNNDANYVNKHKEASLNIFPNPANESIFIESNEIIEWVRLVNINGNIIISEFVDSKKAKMNVSNINPGIYFIKTQTKNSLIDEKIVIVR